MSNRYRLLSLDAWRESEGGWSWNDVYRTHHVLSFEGWPTARKLLAAVRECGYLSEYSKGEVEVEEYGEGSFELRWRNDHQPFAALELIEEEG